MHFELLLQNNDLESSMLALAALSAIDCLPTLLRILTSSSNLEFKDERRRGGNLELHQVRSKNALIR